MVGRWFDNMICRHIEYEQWRHRATNYQFNMANKLDMRKYYFYSDFDLLTELLRFWNKVKRWMSGH
jgi:hypothetical protein